MSIYEQKFNYSVGNSSVYTDDVTKVLRAIVEQNVTSVAIGYADEEYVPETSTRTGGWLYTRRTERVLTAAEFVAEFGGSS